MSTIVSVAIYEVDRAYGGPEEGGWYYTAVPSDEFAIHTKIFKANDVDGIDAHREELSALANKINTDEQRKHPSSVLSNGDYLAVGTREGYPSAYPESRPHYE